MNNERFEESCQAVVMTRGLKQLGFESLGLSFWPVVHGSGAPVAVAVTGMAFGEDSDVVTIVHSWGTAVPDPPCAWVGAVANRANARSAAIRVVFILVLPVLLFHPGAFGAALLRCVTGSVIPFSITNAPIVNGPLQERNGASGLTT